MKRSEGRGVQRKRTLRRDGGGGGRRRRGFVLFTLLELWVSRYLDDGSEVEELVVHLPLVVEQRRARQDRAGPARVL